MSDLTKKAVRRQLEAMGENEYELSIHEANGRVDKDYRVSIRDIIQRIPRLAKSNAQGADIYVRPAGKQNPGLVLLDDLDQSMINQMAEEGIPPALVTETSPNNYQAWVRIRQGLVDNDIASGVGRFLAKTYNADPNSTDWRHIGRLAGFTNRKEKHQKPDGYYPFVRVISDTGEALPVKIFDYLVQEAKKETAHIQARRAELNNVDKKQLFSGQRPSEGKGAVAPAGDFALKAFTKSRQNGSEADFAVACLMLRSGYGGSETAQALNDFSPELYARKRGHVSDYLERTVTAAAVDRDIPANRQKTNKGREVDF